MFTQNPVITFHYDFAHSLRLVIPYKKKNKKKKNKPKQIAKKKLKLKENSFNEKFEYVTNIFYSKFN